MSNNAKNLPEVKLGQYKGLAVTRHVRPLSEKTIDQEMVHQTRMRSVYHNSTAPAKRGSRVLLDFVGFMDGEEIPDSRMEKVMVVLGASYGIGADLALQGSIMGAVVFFLLFNLVHFGLRFGLAHYAYRMGVAAIPLIKANTRKVGHAASIVGMTVIGALVATYVRLGTTLEITAGDAVVKLQADVLDKLMPAFLPLLYTLAMYGLIRRGWSPLRLIVITVVLGIVGKFAGFL